MRKGNLEDERAPMDFSSGTGRIITMEELNEGDVIDEGTNYHPRRGPVIHGSFETQPWFFPYLRRRNVIRAMVERYMPEDAEGLFCVTASEDSPTTYCLVFVKNRFVHQRLIKTRQKQDGTVIYFVDDEGTVIFDDITKLVEYYATIPDIVCDGSQLRTKLRKYLKKNEDRHSDQEYLVVPFNPPVRQQESEQDP